MKALLNSDPFHVYFDAVKQYLQQQDFAGIDELAGQQFTVTPLAKGEYNLNYLLHCQSSNKSSGDKFVFRVNMGTQIDRDDQIVYEFDTLKLLQKSQVTPKPHFVDDSRNLIDKGISIMEYLPGRHLEYGRDTKKAAKVFSKIHQLDVSEINNHLIVENEPLSLIFTECKNLLETYFRSPLADQKIRTFLEQILQWAENNRTKEKYYQQNPWNCIVNTEVNSGNFIVNDEKETTHLIDWEMPRWGDPSTDLCHFCSPLTTLWKTDYLFSKKSSTYFLSEYKKNLKSQSLCDTLEERMHLKFPFVLLRGISWSAMGWVAYQTDYEGMRDNHTWKTLQRYMDIDFIRSLFLPYISS
ncbi:MAG: aminoglycoside phosphotransferase family protein [Desulfotalea sp.]